MSILLEFNNYKMDKDFNGDGDGTGDRYELREAIQRALPNTEYTAARRMVWAWWQHDYPDGALDAEPTRACARLPSQKANP